MELIVLGSSSAGNGYILRDSNQNCLILEAGVRFQEVKKALGFNTRGILAALVTHRHGDHIKHVQSYLEAGIDIYTGKANGVSGHRFKEIEPLKERQIGAFRVIPFEVFHDVETFGFLIQHPESGNLCFLTDTAFCKYTFPGLNNIIIEANYSREILLRRFEAGELNAVVRDRVFKSHLSFENMLEFLAANDLQEVNKIVLIHLSSGNADPEQFEQKTREFTGKSIEIARPGRVIPLNKTPF